jgi:hypothetical protein
MWLVLPWRWWSDEDDDRPDGGCILISDEEVDESWWRTWRSKRAVVKIASQKTLFTISWCRIAEDDGSGDLLSRSQMHVDERDEVAMPAQQRRRRKTRWAGGSCLLVIVTRSMVATRIYRKDLTRVTTSRNLLGLSLSKRIRHGLIEKNKLQNEAMDLCGFGSDFRLASITSPRHATPYPTRQGEASERACVYPFLLYSTHWQVYREQHTFLVGFPPPLLVR